MKDRHHYDPQGNYLGKSSDKPPTTGNWGLVSLILGLIILLCFLGPILQLFGLALHFLGPLAGVVVLLLIVGAMLR